jgi:hypothetical protein
LKNNNNLVLKKEFLNLNLKHLYIFMDEIITNSLNQGNLHFFITINFQEEIKDKKKIKLKIKELEKKIDIIEMVSWYNITTQKNKKKNYHIHFIIAIKSILGYNEVLKNNIKYFFINEFEIDTKVDVCWKFIDIKKAWKYLYKPELEIKEEKEIKKETEIKENVLDPKDFIETKKKKSKKIKINEEEKIMLIKENTEKTFLTWVKENEGKLSNQSFEALMEVNLFWEESENIIKNLSKENKIKLAQILEINIEEFNDPKEINFKIFINFLSKEIKK